MILIVDDDPSVTASLSLLLKQAGHASVTAPARTRRSACSAAAASISSCRT